MASMFRDVIDFFGELGVYDVVLPFLLVYTVSFAILEKTRIFGYYELEDGKTESRKNLNSMMAFVLGFIAVASSRIVSIINEGLANITIVMISIISFMLLAGSLFNEQEFNLGEGKFNKNLRYGLVIVALIATILIFFDAIKTEDGDSWLEVFWEFVSQQWDSTAVGSIIMLLIMLGFVVFVTKDKKPDKNKDDNG